VCHGVVDEIPYGLGELVRIAECSNGTDPHLHVKPPGAHAGSFSVEEIVEVDLPAVRSYGAIVDRGGLLLSGQPHQQPH